MKSSPRGWFTFSLAAFELLFSFDHIWHSAITLFREIFACIDPDIESHVEFGAFQMSADPSTKRQVV